MFHFEVVVMYMVSLEIWSDGRPGYAMSRFNAAIIRKSGVGDMRCLSLPRRRDTTKIPVIVFTEKLTSQSFIYVLLLAAKQLIDRAHRYP